MFNYGLLFLFFTIITLDCFSQNTNSFDTNQERNCATMDLHYIEMQNNPTYKTNFIATQDQIFRLIEDQIGNNDGISTQNVGVTIPVVFHIIHNTGEPVGTGTNLSENYINEQLSQLNDDFRAMNADIGNVPTEFQPVIADLDIEFCLAVRDPNDNPTNGINRYDYGQNSYSIDDFQNTIKPATIWDRDNYLNFWTANLEGGLLGYAQFPGGNASTDGIVCDYATVGSLALPNPDGGTFARGRTATHEIGHWLSLYHIWGDDNGSCTGTDQVSDTPNQGNNYTGTPTHPQSSCGSNDMFMNYMDYVNDVAMYMFSSGQKARSDATLAGPRANLLNSQGCVPVNEFRLSVTNDSQKVCSGDNASFEFDVTFFGNYNGTVNLSSTGLPAGAQEQFSSSSITGTETILYTVSNTNSISPGTYQITITGDDGSITNSITLNLIVDETITQAATLSEPANNATFVLPNTSFVWSTISSASSYTFELSELSDFSVITNSQTTNANSITISLAESTQYYWRVIPNNSCGSGPTSSTFTFITGTTPHCDTYINDGGFEETTSPNPNWTEFSTNGFDLISTDLPANGNNSAWLGGSDNELSLIWQNITIPSDASIANLKFSYSIASTDICGFDFGGVTVVNETNSTYTTGLLDLDLCSTTDNNEAFIEECFDLLSYAGQTIGVGFYALTDGASSSSLFIDDVELYICVGENEIIPTNTSDYIADYEVTDAQGWTHYLDDNGTSCITTDDMLLLSIQKNGEDIGVIGDGTFSVKLSSNPSSSQIASTYNNNSTSWYTQNRYWDVTPTTQPSSLVKVRHYFAQNDMTGLETATGQTLSDFDLLNVWKINDVTTNWDDNPINGHPNVPAASSVEEDGLWLYSYDTNSSSTTFSIGNYQENYFAEFEVAHFSGGGLGLDESVILPVELIDFEANSQNSDAILSWTTLSETDNSYFEIERSPDGISFEAIAQVNSKAINGNSQHIINYDYIDKYAAIQGDDVFYRLKQVDFNGDFSHSEIRLVNFSGANIETIAYPNPVVKGESLVVLSNEIYNIQVVSRHGKLLRSIDYNTPVKSTSIATNDLPSGLYVVIINGNENLKFIIQ